jgi:hypothetical protein
MLLLALAALIDVVGQGGYAEHEQEQWQAGGARAVGRARRRGAGATGWHSAVRRGAGKQEHEPEQVWCGVENAAADEADVNGQNITFFP